jgi:hypothetical protein
MGGDVRKQAVESGPSNQNVVRREHEADLIVATFRVQKLGPRQYVGPVDGGDLQRILTRFSPGAPHLWITG